MHLNLLVIRTSEPKKLAKFYELLGIAFQYHRHGKGPFHYSAEIEKMVFEIYPFLKSQKEPDSSLRLGFSIKNIDALFEEFEKNEVKILKNPEISEWGYFGIIEDPDGRKIEIIELES